MHHEKSSGIIVYKVQDGEVKFLFLKRKEGFLDFPKGHIEKGESEVESAIRETREEAGLELVPEESFRHEQEYWFTHSGERIRKTVAMFLARAPTDAKVKVSFEHADFVWLSYEDALTRLSYKNQKEMLTRAMNSISTGVSS